MKSRPVYGTLTPRPGNAHLLVADAEGAAAILDMAPRAPAGFFDKAHIIFVRGPRADFLAPLAALRPHILYEGASVSAVLPRLAQSLATARMGLQLYLAGTEGLIGQAMKVAMEHGIDHHAIETEHRGSAARRVQCVHCKGITEDVRTQPVRCSHCGVMLFVRDHYSRRIAAFQGVCIDAEEPGAIPPVQEAFP
ncbi:dimethylamine monooxygenase subunit DmmA family protein [Acidisoma sp. 7E03]